jgi:hypothetical protein
LESVSSSRTEENGNNMSLVNDNVFQSIVTRLELLEKSKISELEQNIFLFENKNAVNIQKILSLEHLVSSLEQKINILQETHSEPKTIDTKDIDDKIISLNTQIDQLKDTLLSLQTYTMNTNTKLIDLIITNTEMSENENEEENEDITKHLENLFRHNFETEETNTNLFEETLNEDKTTPNTLTLNEEDLSTLSINI